MQNINQRDRLKDLRREDWAEGLCRCDECNYRRDCGLPTRQHDWEGDIYAPSRLIVGAVNALVILGLFTGVIIAVRLVYQALS